MTSQQLEEIMKKLDIITKKQDEYEQLSLKNKYDAVGTFLQVKLQELNG